MKKTTIAALLLICAFPALQLAGPETPAPNTITLHEPGSPFIAFNIWIKTGSQNDPPGKEGLASLTASLLANGSTRSDSFQAILEKLYPMAAGYDYSVDKEMTVFAGRVHRDNLEAYYTLFKQAVLEPAFLETDFRRIKSQTMNYLRQSRRFSNDEELSKELLFREIYRGTPYEHPEEGYATSVESITLDEVKAFYKANYTRGNVVVGVGGGYPSGFAEKLRADFNTLPEGKVEPAPQPRPAAIEGINILIVEKETRATPISFGFPISLLRSDGDFLALMLANSWMGEHRNSFSNLYQVIREKRGMNYGNYSYIEAYPAGFATQVPPVNVSRRSQIFEVWIRPIALTDPGTLHDRSLFAFRAALREVKRFAERGMTAESFENTRRFLKYYTANFGATIGRRLAYRVDDAFYSLKDPGFLNSLKPGLDALILDKVNATIRKHLRPENLWVVFITKDAEGMKKKLLEGSPTKITYAGEQAKSLLDEDEIIASFPIPVTEDKIKIIHINEVFER